MRKALFCAVLISLGTATARLPGQIASSQVTQTPSSQPTPAQTSQPTSSPTPSPLRTPQSMLDYFLTAVGTAEEHPERLTDAVACLDLSRVDPEVAREHAPGYARKLHEIVRYLMRVEGLDPAELPDDPAAETQVIGKDPLLLVLERSEQRVWQFAPSTVTEIPHLYAVYQETVIEAVSETQPEPATTTSVADVDELLRSPWATVTSFLLALSEAEEDPSRYERALACLNFGALEPDVVSERGPDYADQLGRILQKFLDTGLLKLEDLPDEPHAEHQTIGREPVLLILTRDDDRHWQFSAQTVAQLPELYGRLSEALARLPGAEEPPTPSVASSVPAEFRSPRTTLETFWRAMAESDLRAASRCLDLSDLSPAERQAGASILAGKLLLVLKRHQVIVFQMIPDEPDFDGPYKLLVNRYGRVELHRQAGGPRNDEWLFSAATVRSIENLYTGGETRPLLPQYRGDPGISFFTLPSLWLRERIIAPSLKRVALGLQYWQWLGLVLVVLAGYLVHRAANRVLPWIARRVFPTKPNGEVFAPEPGSLRPLTLLALVTTWWGGVQLLDLGAQTVGLIWPALRLLVVILGAWALYRFVDLLTAYSVARAARREARLDDVLVPLVRKTMKVLVVAVGATMVLTVVGFEVGPLLAGLGIGGLAFSFAAKDTIANFFGSVNVVLDRPFQVGDYVKIGPHEGTVESVGLRSSRLRTFRDSLLIIPNAEIMTAAIDNMGRRRYRRMHATLTLSYATTPEQLEAFCEGIRELIQKHPQTRKQGNQVWVGRLSPSAIEIEVYCFFETADWGHELRERHQLLLEIMRLAQRTEIRFVAA